MTTTGPQPCETCGHTDWGNPIPVVTIIQPVRCAETGMVGLAIAKRADPPYVGRWALIGGHVEKEQSLEVAAHEEWSQETGLTLKGPLTYAGSHIASNGKLLVGFVVPPISLQKWQEARLCHENLAFGVLWAQHQIEELCFPIHQNFARQFLAR